MEARSRYYPTFLIDRPIGGSGAGGRVRCGHVQGQGRAKRRPTLGDTRTGESRAARGATRPEGRFDGFGVAKRGAVIEGRVDAAQLPRMSDLLAPEGGESELRYGIAGSADGAGRPALEVSLSGTVPLTCQRCLQPFACRVEQRTLLLLARDERELARLDAEDHEHEVVLADAPLDPLTLVEDELLLTLPYVPRCPESQCRAAHEKGSG